MKEFECHHKDVLIRSTVLSTLLSGFGPYKRRGERILKRALGVEEVKISEDSHYPLHLYMDAIQKLQEQFGQGFMTRIGFFTFETAKFPPEETLEKMLPKMDVAYHMNHVNSEGKIGRYVWTPTGDKKGTMEASSPYPCAFDLGILQGLFGKLAPGEHKVEHDPTCACRFKGGDSCTYILEW